MNAPDNDELPDELEVQEWSMEEGSPDELVEVIIRKGNTYRQIKAHTVMVVATSRGSDRTWNIIVGQAEFLGRIFATAVRIGVTVEEFDSALAVQLIRDYAATARAIGSAFIRHSQWEGKKHGKAQGSPGTHPGNEGSSGPGGTGESC